MAIPSDPVLIAAARWLEHLPRSTVERTRALFSAHPGYADVTPTQYAAGLDWLLGQDLLASPPGPGAARDTVFDAAVAGSLWFADFDALVSGPGDLPGDAARAAETLGLGEGEAYARARHLFGKVDTEARKVFGTAAEIALTKLLAAVPNGNVAHLAAESDGYGYDILFTLGGRVTHLEVKATNRRRRLTIHLSRNEYETMRRDRDWVLAAVLLDADLQPAAVATVDRDWIAAAAPADQAAHGRWESARVDVPVTAIRPGLAVVSGVDMPPALAVLSGDPPWAY